MKTDTPIHIRAGDLKPALVGLGKIASPKAPSPELQCIRVEPISSKAVRLTASNGDLRLEVKMTAKLEDGATSLLIPISNLRERVRGCKARDLVQLESEAKAPEVSEFPAPIKFRAAPTELTAGMSTRLLRAFTCASQDPTRHLLQGALLDVSGTGEKAHRIVATDGRQLFSSNSMQLPALKSSVIIPDHAVWKWKRIAEPAPWTLRVGAEKGGLIPFRIDAEGWSLSGKTIVGNYPNYRQVIPAATEFKSQVMMPPAVITAIADLIPKLPGKKIHNRPVGIHVEKGLLSLLAREAVEDPWQFYPIGKTEVTGPDQLAFANRDYVQRALKFGLNEISLTDDKSPLQFSQKGDLMIVMPLRVNDAKKLKRPRNLTPLVTSETTAPKKAVAAKRQTTSAKAKTVPKTTDPKADPIHEVEARIAEANDALATVGKKLESAKGSLGTARDQRSDDQSELRGLHSLFSSIRKFAIGSN